MRHYHRLAGLGIAAALLAAALPASAQRAPAKGNVRALPQRPASSADLGKGQAVRPGAPLKVARSLPDGRPINLMLSLDALPSANLHIAGAAFLPAGQTLIVHIENQGSEASQEGTLVASVQWGANVDRDNLSLRQGVSGKTQDELIGSVVRDAMAKMALGINYWATSVKPLPPGGHAIVAIDLPDVTEEIAFCGFAGKQAKTDCVDPATESVLSVKLLPNAIPGFGPGK